MAEYLSVKAFAKRAGVTTQAIYQRTSKDLQAYLKIENGKKLLSTEALQLFNSERNESKTCKSKDDTFIVQALLAQLETKDKQLAEKDKQIEGLADALRAEQKLHAATAKQLLLLQAGQQSEAQPEPETENKDACNQSVNTVVKSDTEPEKEALTGWEKFKKNWHYFWFD